MRDDHVERDGRSGVVRDIDGPDISIVWDDDPSYEAREWVRYSELRLTDDASG